jgi:CheY-like chemotaxis protein
LEDDLLFGSGIEARLRVLGYTAAFADKTPAFDRLLKASPALVLVNVGSPTLDWQHLVDHAKNESQWRHVPILAYGPHTDLDLHRQALAAGCDAVVARSAVATNLPALVQKWAWQPDLSPCQDALPPALLRGIQEFNRREFFECHETIEAAWMVEPRSIRLLYQGILQVGVALYHVQRQNWRGAMKVLARALPKLAHFEPACMGVDVGQLLADTRCIRQQLIQLGEQRIGEFDPGLFPTIRIITLPANPKEDLSL